MRGIRIHSARPKFDPLEVGWLPRSVGVVADCARTRNGAPTAETSSALSMLRARFRRVQPVTDLRCARQWVEADTPGVRATPRPAAPMRVLAAHVATRRGDYNPRRQRSR